MAQLDTPAAGGEAVNPDSSLPATDPIEALADSWFDDDEKQDEAPAAEASDGGELTEDDLDDEAGDDAKPIDAPVSWTAEEKARFGELPREVQETITRREGEREKFVQSKASEAAQARQAAERDAIAQVQSIAQRHAEAFRHVLPYIPERPSYQLQVDDPIAFADQMDAHERAVAQHHTVQQRIQQAQSQAQQAEQLLRQHEQQEIQTRLSQEFPEFLDQGESGQKLREQLGSTALALGFPAELLKEVNATEILAMKRATDWKVKADKFDALMAQKMEKVREAKGLPRVSRPGSAPTRAQVGQKAVEASWDRVKQTRGRDRAEAFGDYLTKTGQL